MLKFELTHKCTLIQQLFLISTWTAAPGGGAYVHFRVSDVTNPGGSLCSPYQPFVVVLFFKSKYLPLLWALNVVALQMLFMLKQQHYTLTTV